MNPIGDRHLDWLAEEAIFVLREVAASFERPALLFSGGKDSCVVLRLAEKAFKQRVHANDFKGLLVPVTPLMPPAPGETQQALPLQPYTHNRVGGALIVVDAASHRTSGALLLEEAT